MTTTKNVFLINFKANPKNLLNAQRTLINNEKEDGVKIFVWSFTSDEGFHFCPGERVVALPKLVLKTVTLAVVGFGVGNRTEQIIAELEKTFKD